MANFSLALLIKVLLIKKRVVDETYCGLPHLNTKNSFVFAETLLGQIQILNHIRDRDRDLMIKKCNITLLRLSTLDEASVGPCLSGK